MTPKHVEYLLVSQMPFLLSYNLQCLKLATFKKNHILGHFRCIFCEKQSLFRCESQSKDFQKLKKKGSVFLLMHHLHCKNVEKQRLYKVIFMGIIDWLWRQFWNSTTKKKIYQLMVPWFRKQRWHYTYKY